MFHLNTYAMGLWPLKIFLFSQCIDFSVIDFRRQNLMSTDGKFWRLKSIPALWDLRLTDVFFTQQNIYWNELIVHVHVKK